MLILSRPPSKSILIGPDVIVTVLAIRGDQVRPASVRPETFPCIEEIAERISRAGARFGMSSELASAIGAGPY